jgi:flavin-dependent dehydrogenase
MTENKIIIAGGSLAGIACALRLKQLGHQSLVLEKHRFPRPKLCGEFLGPDAFPILEQLAIAENVLQIGYGPIEKVLFHDMRDDSLEIPLIWISKTHPYAWAIPRSQLDTVLMELARKQGIEVLEERQVHALAQQKDHHFQLLVRQPFDTLQERYTCQWLIDATGRNGRLSLPGNSQSRPANRELVGIQCHLQISSRFLNSHLRMFLFPGGYGGLQPLGENIANLCLLVDSALAKSLHGTFATFIQETIGQNPVAARWLNDATRLTGFQTTADINLDPLPEPGGILRIGDAHVTVDPFTGSGMAHALETGVLAAECLHQTIQANEQYDALLQRYQQTYRQRFKRRLDLMHFCRPALNSSGIRRILWPLLPPVLPSLARMLR